MCSLRTWGQVAGASFDFIGQGSCQAENAKTSATGNRNNSACDIRSDDAAVKTAAMTSDGPGDGPPTTSLRLSSRETGPYVLRTLLDEVPLSADGSQDDIKINCVDYLDANLYVGTSASELLHFVQIPPDPNDSSGQPVYILASRLCPQYVETPGTPNSRPGVQQILLLPRVGKACILCNWTVTFYSLPELSPVFGTTLVKNCSWIGGIDLNEPLIDGGSAERSPGVTILLSLMRKIQVVRVGEDARAFKKIDFSGSTLSVRRDSIACVADSKSYALLDVEQQLKIPLMSISSLEETTPPSEIGHAQSIAAETSSGILRSSSSAQSRPSLDAPGHSRSTSLGGSILGNIRRQDQRGNEGEDSVARTPSPHPPTSPRPPTDRASTPNPPSLDKPLPAAPSRSGTPTQSVDPKPKPGSVFLKPHITSPTPDEFLLVTGTNPLEPGIGMFVNLDGDPTRPTLEFTRYPREVVVDSPSSDLSASQPALPQEEEGYVLASMTRESDDGLHHGLEIQRLDAGSQSNPGKYWLTATEAGYDGVYGIRSLAGSEETRFEEIVERLCQRRYTPFSISPESPLPYSSSLKSVDSRTALSMERLSKEKELFDRNVDSQDEESLPEEWEANRNSEGEEFARQLAKAQARLAVWSGSRIWWAIRNPLLIQLDAALQAACPGEVFNPGNLDRRAIFATLNSIRGQEARTELEFMTYGYIRQKAGILLLTNLLKSPQGNQFTEGDVKALEEVLVESGLDPRVVLSLIPGIRNEMIEGQRGIWIYGGVRKTADAYLHSRAFEETAKDKIGTLEPKAMHFLRRYLGTWRKRKGFGSVADEREVFHTVDAALLLVLLEIDQRSPKGLGKGGVVRSELYEVVDKGVDCFDRAVDLLESYQRLFVLSRLYQSRKLSGDVLATWRRIIDGEPDVGQELRDGEQRVREYLTKVSSQALVQEYGVWLANRNPKLGVQVFAEDKGRAPKFEPSQVVEILREEAPDAVKYYLEHLVFGKGHTTYINDLMAYYLDVVVTDLETSSVSRDIVRATYGAYRALQAPKPTYSHFLRDNAPDDNEVWHSRLRLLQLLGDAHDYDAAAIRDRISTVPDDLLVPETIILAGRERNHDDAIRLLIHNLGDYDTAVSYCLRGGASTSGAAPAERPSIEEQRRLFHVVLRELLALEDASDRIEQTGALLERFGGWFEIDEVLGLIPDDWSVDIVAGFLVGALKRLIGERRESMLTRALSGAENLRVNYDLVVGVEEKGPSIEAPN
ncbi:TGF beta receptor associated 1 [Fusarium albosuccineum]|uniref:TGF beta receptor associated 1 n=1 Tax=Fusarium albosuccineum TaxID=1237068 RepID=A0A8H4LIB4_9HYPO|nr:TGF beta receptor associated 1 [Fusarium albosuccineum]